MSGSLAANSSIIQNTISGSVHLSIWMYDKDDKLLRTVNPGEVLHNETFLAHHVRVFFSPTAKKYFFPKKVTLNPGDVIVFTPAMGGLKTVSIFVNLQLADEFDLTSSSSAEFTAADTAVAAHTDLYMDKILTLARLHVLLGSTKDEFNADLEARGITDTATTKKLTKGQFNVVNEANANIQLQGTTTDETDQKIYDETAMLSTAVNTRLAAIANAAHPDQWDISVPENQIKMTNAAANGLFNWYYSHMGAFLTSINMSTAQVTNTYNTTTIKLDAIVDLFKSLSLPGDKLEELSGAVDSFVENMRNLSSESQDKGLHNAKLTNFFSIQPPEGSPELAKVAKMRMFYLQFNEATHEWSNSCSSGATYKLDTDVFTLDVEINRQVCHLTYDHNINLVVTNADTSLDEMGAAGAPDTAPPVKTDGPRPLGPPPVN